MDPIASSSSSDKPHYTSSAAIGAAATDNQESWRAYEKLMREIMNDAAVIKKCKDVEAVQRFLLDKSWPVPANEILDAQNYQQSPGTPSNFRDRLGERKMSFMGTWGFNKKQKEYMERCLTYAGDRSASRADATPLPIAWMKWRLAGCPTRENCFSTYMYGLGLLEKEHGNNELAKLCLWDTVSIHDLLYPPNEKTVTLRIQSFISQDKPEAAEELLQALSMNTDVAGKNTKAKAMNMSRLRTFAPVLSYYCRKGQMAAALHLFDKMRRSKGVHLDAATYAMLIGSLASHGYFNDETGETLIDSRLAAGEELFNELLVDMASDILELTEEAAQTLYEGFTGETQTIPSLTATDMNDEKLLIGRVSVNETTATCSATGATLRLLALDDKQRNHVRDTLLEMSFSLQEEYRQTKKSKGMNVDVFPSGEYCRTQLQNFSDWLESRTESCDSNPFSSIVDGANIAHFGSGTVQYNHIKLMVEKLEHIGENPLVIMPYKYTTKGFYLQHIGKYQKLEDRDLEVINHLVDRGKMYVVPASCFDDYYWMIASVAKQGITDNSSVEGTTISGLRPILVTNDQMRDHRLSLLEPRPFRRWTSCHIVNYEITPFQNGVWVDREVTLHQPGRFSREIQANDVPGKADRRVWHFPVENWDETDRLALSLAFPQRKENR